MGMSAEIHVHPRIRQFLKFSRLMIDNQHWQWHIHTLCDFLRSLSFINPPSGTLIIRSAIQIKGIIDEHIFISQKRNPRFLQKLIHLRGTLFLFLTAKGKSRQNLFLNIVVSVTCIHTILWADPSQYLRQFFRIIQCLIFIVKNISCHYHQIRFLLIDLLCHLLHLLASNIISQMKICDQNHI